MLTQPWFNICPTVGAQVFGSLGEITRAFIPAPRDGKTRREFGFVHYVDRASVLQAIKQNDEGDKFVMDGTPLDVRLLSCVHVAHPETVHRSQLFLVLVWSPDAFPNLHVARAAIRAAAGAAVNIT